MPRRVCGVCISRRRETQIALAQLLTCLYNLYIIWGTFYISAGILKDNMDITFVIGLTVGLLTIAGVLIAGVRWLVHHYFEEIKHEMKPNSGASMKDQITRMDEKIIIMEKNQEELKQDNKDMDANITRIYNTLIDYITKGSNR